MSVISLKNIKSTPAPTISARENQMVSMAIDLAEKQLRDGTASSQIITHYLKLGSTVEKLNSDYMKKKMELMDAQIKAIDSAKELKDLYEEAIDAMKLYSGNNQDE